MDIKRFLPKNLSLRWKFTVAFGVIAFLCVFLTSIIAQLTNIAAVRVAFEEKLASIILVTSNQLKVNLRTNDTLAIDTILAGLRQDQNVMDCWVFDLDRRVISDGTNENMDK